MIGGHGMGLVTDAPHHDLCYRIIGAAMDVHNRLGPGLREVHYQRALMMRLAELGLDAVAEYPVKVMVDDRFVGDLFMDCLVEDAVVVELKALSHLLTNDEVAQVITYLAASGKRVGLLFNFGRGRLEFKRIFPPKARVDWEGKVGRYLSRPSESGQWRGGDGS